MTEPAHSPLGGSSLKRWSKCPGSINLSRGIPTTSSSYADEGTKAHEAAAYYLLTGRNQPKVLDQEMLDAIEVYTDAIIGDEFGRSVVAHVEQRVSLEKVHPGLFGTADYTSYCFDTKLLRIYDYKHGVGTVVEVMEDGQPNLQLMYYALGVALAMGPKQAIGEIELIIVQPRAYHPDGPVRRTRVTPFQLMDFASDLKEYATATEDPSAPLHSGDHCKYCPAAGICTELHKNAVSTAQTEFRPELSYDPAKLATTLGWLPVLDAYIKSVREFAYSEAQHGRIPPGFKLVQKRATRKWLDEGGAVLALSRLLDDAALFKKSLKSPAQIEKLLTKENKALVGYITAAESSGQTLVPDTDKREDSKARALLDFDVI